jgi:predicted transcriptional regulator of viral defense system
VEREFGHERKYLRLMLHRMVERGDLVRVERGKFTVHEDPMVYATHIETPSFFSYWTALRYYNLTSQQPFKLHVVARKNRDDLDGIKFHSTAKIFGYQRRPYRDLYIFVADRERLLLDCLAKSTVPVEELAELAREIDCERMTRYCEEFGNRSLAKRAGYLLEREGKKAEKLHGMIDHNYVPIDLSKPVEGRKNTRWKIVVNTDAA